MSTRKVTIKNLDPISVGKIQGVILAFFALIFAAFFALIVIAAGSAVEEVGGSFGLAVGALIIGPIIYGVIGFVGGVIGALIYNLAAGVVGGIQFDFRYEEGQL